MRNIFMVLVMVVVIVMTGCATVEPLPTFVESGNEHYQDLIGVEQQKPQVFIDGDDIHITVKEINDPFNYVNGYAVKDGKRFEINTHIFYVNEGQENEYYYILIPNILIRGYTAIDLQFYYHGGLSYILYINVQTDGSITLLQWSPLKN